MDKTPQRQNVEGNVPFVPSPRQTRMGSAAEDSVTVASAVAVSVTGNVPAPFRNADDLPTVFAATVTVHVFAVDTGVDPPTIPGVTRITYVPDFEGVSVTFIVLRTEAAEAVEIVAKREFAVVVSTTGVPRSVVATVAVFVKVTSLIAIPEGAASYVSATVIESEVVS